MSAQSLVNAGYYGYQGWGDAQADADFRATGGAGKGGSNNGGSSGGSGGYQQVSAADIAKLQEQIYGIVSPYYQALAEKSKGDFNVAKQIMLTDYQQGTRQAKEKLSYEQKYGQADLKNSLSSLGLTFGNENDQLVDKLNQRGMAVYEGQGNVVQPGAFTPSYDTDAYTYNPGVNASPTESLGRGGQELGKLRQDQALRSEALLRTKMQPLEQAGLNFKQYTNPNGFDPNNPSAFTGDKSQLGTAETSALKQYSNAQQDYTQRLIDQKAQQTQNVTNLANTYANTSNRSLDTNATNQLQKQYNTDFLQSGLT